MTEALLTQLAVAVLFIPLLGFTFSIFFGKKLKWAYILETSLLFIAFVITVVIAFFKLGQFSGTEKIISQFEWINLGDTPLLGWIKIELGVLIDNISVIMLFVVFLISLLVHLFSIAYMKGDERYNRYFAYLGLFTFSMTGIVITHNVLMMYIFWELVGVSSYLLIGFWFEKQSASDAAKKAFLTNRIGDLAMLAGILILFVTYQTFSFETIFAEISQGKIPFNSGFWLTVTGILLFGGAVGKSAQFPLHVWLPDAMEGPTPVSALIHAATMVAAGVYFIARIFTMLTGDALMFIAVIGMISAFIPATIALTQTDIKKVLAYSTISQLGYMIMALGIGAYTFAFFHLITHAFFKACLFLGSGSVIHAMHHEQEITKMGGLRKKMPITYATFLLASLAISGVPLTSGFLSKDGILAGSYAFASLTGHYLFPIVGFLVAMLTAFYMFRLIILTFHGQPKDQHKYEHAHESPFVMVLPLVILAGLSIFIFYTPNPFDANAGWFVSKWVKAPEISVPDFARYGFMVGAEETGTESGIVYSETYTEAVHHAHYPAMFLSLAVAGIGILFAFLMYQWKKINPDALAGRIKPLYNFSYNKWYFDELYNATFIAGTLALSRMLNWFDQKVVDGIVNGSASVTRILAVVVGKFDTYVVDGLVNLMAYLSGLIGLFFRGFQTGRVQTYIVFVIFSLVILLFLFKSF